MTFLAEESVDRQIVDALRDAGYSVSYVLESSPGISDSKVLQEAIRKNAILITSDKDFGELAFRRRLENQGIVLLRLSGMPQDRKASIFRTVKITFDDDLLRKIVKVARQESLSWSELIRECARSCIEGKQRWSRVFESAERQAVNGVF